MTKVQSEMCLGDEKSCKRGYTQIINPLDKY